MEHRLSDSYTDSKSRVLFFLFVSILTHRYSYFIVIFR